MGHSKHKFKVVNAPLWEVSLSEDNPLNSKIESLSAGAIANAIVYQPTNAFVGNNIFQIRVNVLQVFKLEPAVTVTLSSGDSCPVRITPSGNNSWSVTYFVTRYPQHGNSFSDDEQRNTVSSPATVPTVKVFVPTVKVSVEINGVQARNSPMNLHLRNELAVGTRVEQHGCSQLQGTVLSYQQYQQLSVLWL